MSSLTDAQRIALIAAFDDAIAEAKRNDAHGDDQSEPKGSLAVAMAKDLGFDWESDDALRRYCERGCDTSADGMKAIRMAAFLALGVSHDHA